MKALKERIVDLSQYLQRLTHPAVFSKVQNAVEKKDRNQLVEACKSVKIPELYIGAIVSVLLSVRQPKWPAPDW